MGFDVQDLFVQVTVVIPAKSTHVPSSAQPNENGVYEPLREADLID